MLSMPKKLTPQQLASLQQLGEELANLEREKDALAKEINASSVKQKSSHLQPGAASLGKNKNDS